jgi:ABC-type uncharacterized transport system permease subunit
MVSDTVFVLSFFVIIAYCVVAAFVFKLAWYAFEDHDVSYNEWCPLYLSMCMMFWPITIGPVLMFAILRFMGFRLVKMG